LKDENALLSLAQGLSEKGEVKDVTSQIIIGLAPDNRFKVLKAALESRDETTRINALELIGTVKDPRFVDPVLALLRDSTSQDEIKTIRSVLKKFRDKIDIERHLRIARFGSSKEERDLSIQALSIVGDERCIGLLLDLLKDDDVFIRGRAVQALASTGDKRAIPQFEKMLKDKKNERIFPIIKNALNLLSLNK